MSAHPPIPNCSSAPTLPCPSSTPSLFTCCSLCQKHPSPLERHLLFPDSVQTPPLYNFMPNSPHSGSIISPSCIPEGPECPCVIALKILVAACSLLPDPWDWDWDQDQGRESKILAYSACIPRGYHGPGMMCRPNKDLLNE